VRGVPEFLLVALLVTLTPGPATATVIRVAARDGRSAALRAIAGNSAGVLIWAALAATGVSSLILVSRIGYDALRIGGAALLIVLGLRSLLRRRADAEPESREGAEPESREGAEPERKEGAEPKSRETPGRATQPARTAIGWRTGLVTSLCNPKLAVFFVALFPQFLAPHATVLPAALAMAATIVTFDILWYSTLAYLVGRARALLKPRIQAAFERFTGTVLIGLGVRLAAESR
jgi:threonine/homoserine/homoserine lactone efflux protein